MFLCLMVFVGALTLSGVGAYRVFVDWERRIREERIQGTPARPPQFTLRTVIAALAVLGFIATVLRALGSTYWTNGPTAFFVFCILGLFLASLLLPVGLSLLLMGRRSVRLAFCALLVLLLGPCVLIQELIIKDYQKTKQELPQLSRFLEDIKANTGAYPESLSGYVFEHPEIESCILYLPHQSERAKAFDDYRLGLFPYGEFGDQVVYYVHAGDPTWHEGDD